mmetsp:Transcript_1487/g.4007  ORF Transcript_1487/g.4007 Transcript_1487/m.4007 type:complete len:351 (-) Transcript_1487:1313-2365(-)
MCPRPSFSPVQHPTPPRKGHSSTHTHTHTTQTPATHSQGGSKGRDKNQSAGVIQPTMKKKKASSSTAVASSLSTSRSRRGRLEQLVQRMEKQHGATAAPPAVKRRHRPSSKARSVGSGVGFPVEVWRVRDWELVKSLEGHTRRVSVVRVHPSGKAAVSIDQGGCLCLWDLMKGAAANRIQLTKRALDMRWSPSGSCYALLHDTQVVVHDTDTTAGVTLELDDVLRTPGHPDEPCCMCFAHEDLPLIGMRSGNIHGLSLKDIHHCNRGAVSRQSRAVTLAGHTGRIKGIAAWRQSGSVIEVVSACSQGLLCFWRIDGKQLHSASSPLGCISPLRCVETGCTVSCIECTTCV